MAKQPFFFKNEKSRIKFLSKIQNVIICSRAQSFQLSQQLPKLIKRVEKQQRHIPTVQPAANPYYCCVNSIFYIFVVAKFYQKYVASPLVLLVPPLRLTRYLLLQVYVQQEQHPAQTVEYYETEEVPR